MLKRISAVLAILLVAGTLFGLRVSQAQVPALPPLPYNVQLGALITNAARVASTVTSSQQTNLAYNGVICTFNQSAVVSTPSTTFSIQGYDSASNSYLTYVTSGAVTTALATPTPIVVYPGVQTSSLPAGMVALNMKLPAKWRVSQTIAGGAASTTGTIGCDLLK